VAGKSAGKSGEIREEIGNLRDMMPTMCGVSGLDWSAYWAADLHNV